MTQIAVFGASGRTGRLVVDLALSQGIGVRALVRSGSRFDDRPGMVTIRGSLEEARDVTATVSGTTGVCSVFGPRTPKDPPFCARATAQVIAAMRASGIRRLVCQTGAMVGELPSNVSRPMRAMAALFRRQVPLIAADAAEQERLVMGSGLDWTLVKPPRLTDAPPAGRVRAGAALRVGLMSRIGRGDLARILLDEAVHSQHLHTRLYVSG